MSIVPGETKIGNYLMLSQIGSGAFASVWLAQHVTTKIKVAIKIIQKKSIESAEAKTRFNREMALLKQMTHPFIAEFFESIENENFHFLVMEYAENGNMLEFINNKGQLTEPQARHYFSQLVSVLEYLHNEKLIAHRDLKAENVLLDRYNNIRVIDFGLSNQFSSSQPQLKTACGSPGMFCFVFFFRNNNKKKERNNECNCTKRTKYFFLPRIFLSNYDYYYFF